MLRSWHNAPLREARQVSRQRPECVNFIRLRSRLVDSSDEFLPRTVGTTAFRKTSSSEDRKSPRRNRVSFQVQEGVAPAPADQKFCTVAQVSSTCFTSPSASSSPVHSCASLSNFLNASPRSPLVRSIGRSSKRKHARRLNGSTRTSPASKGGSSAHTPSSSAASSSACASAFAMVRERDKADLLVSRYHSHIRRRDAASLTTLRLARDCLKVRESTRLPSCRMMC